MTAYEIFTQLQGLLAQKIPQAEFRECYGHGTVSRLPTKPVATGQVAGGSAKEGGWQAEIAYTLYLPRGCAPSVGEGVLEAVRQVAEEGFPSFPGAARGPLAPDKATGLLAAACTLSFAGEDGTGPGATAEIGGVGRRVSGWEITSSVGKELTAIGEREPFGALATPAYTVELQGIDTAGLERLAGFTVRLGGLSFQRCRWKLLSSTGRRAVFVSNTMEREEVA